MRSSERAALMEGEYTLSTREREVAWLAAEMTTQEIADRLEIEFTTAKYYLDSARYKLRVKKKRELPAALRAMEDERVLRKTTDNDN